MKTIKTILVLAGFSALLFVSIPSGATTQENIAAASRNEKTAKTLANLSTKSNALNAKINKLAKPDQSKIQSNHDRVENLDVLFSKLAANFDKPFKKQVTTYKIINSKMVALNKFDINYNPAAGTNNLGFDIQSNSKSTPLFDNSFSTLFNGIKKNPKLLDSFVNIYTLPISNLQKNKNPALANISKKLLVVPKISLTGVKKVILYVDNENNIARADVLNKQYITYDFSGSIKPETRPNNAAILPPANKQVNKQIKAK